MLGSQLLYILVLATLAGVILFRLYTVLGRRTGHERPPADRFERLSDDARKKPDDHVLLPEVPAPAEPANAAAQDDQQGLLDIKLADRSFETAHFLSGAKRAYEMIVVAFAHGERQTLHPLMNEEVYAAFERVIADREMKGEKVEFTFVGFQDVKVTAASLSNNVAAITVSFASQFMSATVDKAGQPLHGDSKLLRSATDIWTFERNIKASDPNWRLVATSGEAELQTV